jgi:tight adherence protein C
MAVSLMVGCVIALPLVLALAVLEPLLAPLGIIGVVAGPGLVSSSLDRRGAWREREITKAMPFVLDLLVLTMRAGASLQQAIERVALDYAGHPVGVEFQAVLTDLDMGVTTAEGFQNLAERVPIPAVKTFVDDLTGAEELGRPVAEIFERQANRARERRVQEALETAGQAKVTVLVPGMLVFMASLMLLFAPFVVRYYYGGYTAG